MPEPSAVVAVALTAWVYGRGVRTVWNRAGRGHGIQTWQVVCFGGGLLTLLIALESPLEALSADLFAAHMVQHMLLILVVGPLLVFGSPMLPVLWSVPWTARRRLGGLVRRFSALERPSVAFCLHSAALWAWHLPLLYEAALANRAVHALEHVSFLGTATQFWWAVLRSRRPGHAPGAAYIFGLALETTLLGALLTFAQAPWYSAHVPSAQHWGISALEDQQLAGLIMWVPGGAIYLIAALWQLFGWLTESAQPLPESRSVAAGPRETRSGPEPGVAPGRRVPGPAGSGTARPGQL